MRLFEYIIHMTASGASTSSLWDGLQAYYTADNTGNDALGTYNGTLTNGTTYDTGIINQGFSFDGVNDYVAISPVIGASLSAPNVAHSYSAWVYPTNLTDQYNFVFQNGDSTSGTSLILSTNKIGFFYRGGTNFKTSTATLTLNAWNHIVTTIDTSGNLRFYLNGAFDVLRTGITWTETPTYAFTQIGRYATGVHFFNGTIDEVGVWDKELTSDEVTELYNAGSALQYPTGIDPVWSDLLAYYTADNTPNDALGNFNGTLVNGATYGTGIISNGFSFDGINDYINFGNVLDFDGSTPFSFSFWVNPNTLGNKNLLQKWTGVNNGWIIFMFGDKIRFSLTNTATTNSLRVETVNSLTTSMQHISISYDGSKDVSGVNIYFNGVNQSLTTLDNTLTSSTSTGVSFEMGRNVSNIGWYNGIIDEVAVFEKELSASEVTELYNAGAGKQYPVPPSNAFEMTIDTTQAGSASDTFILPAGNSGTYNATVDWGDGTTSEITAYNDADLTHVYSTGGIYTIKISGDFPYISFNNGGDKLKLMSINNWGVNQWRNMQTAFMGCTNLEVYATDIPDFSLCTSFYRAFNLCSSLTTLENINQWDMSAATNLSSMFDRAGLTGDLDLSGWDLSSCTNIGSGGSFPFMYQTNITSLDVSNWNFRPSGTQFNNFIADCDSLTTITGINTWQNTDRITNMSAFVTGCALISSLDFSGMDFSGCSNFYQLSYNNTTLTSLNLTGVTLKTTGTINLGLAFGLCTNLTSISGIESFNSSAVNSLNSTFKNTGLTGDLDLTSWDVSNVTSMNGCFQQNANLNSIDISGWDLSSCTTWGTGQFSACFYGTPISSIDVSNITLNPSGVNCAHTFSNMGVGNVIGLDTWDVSRITSLNLFMFGATITTTEYDKLLIAWDALDPVDGLSVNFGSSKYTSGGAAETARSGLISTDSWTITDGGSV